MRTRLASLAAPLVCLASLSGQVPQGYLLASHQVISGTLISGGMTLLEPSTGVATPLKPAGASVSAFLRCAVPNPNDATTIYGNPGVSTVATLSVTKYTLQGSGLVSAQTTQVAGGAGGGARFAIAGTDLLFTNAATSALGGLSKVPLGGTTAVQLVVLPRAHGLAVIGTKAYCASYQAAMPSTLMEIDLLTLATRTLGVAYPAFRGLCPFGGALMAGDDNGDLLLIQVSSGAFSTFASPAKGAIVAVVENNGLPCLATVNKDVWRFPLFTNPLWTSPGAITDLEVGTQRTAALLAFGKGCVGFAGKDARMTFTALPTIPNPGFALAVGNAQPTIPGAMMLGVSRQLFGTFPLPFDLSIIQMPTCFLYQDLVVALGIVTDGAGAASLPMPIASVPGWAGAHFTAQAFLVDTTSNAVGVASDAIEGILN